MRPRLARLALLLLAVLAGLVTAVLVLRPDAEDDAPTEELRAVVGDLPRDELERRARDGFAHPLFAKSPGGAVATAERVAAWREEIEAAADGSDEDPDVLEGMVFLESAGRPDARASDDLAGAVGLTQILAQTGTDLLGLRVDLEESRRLTRRIARARSDGARATLEARRRTADERFDPRKALAATVRYLAFARGQLGGRDDLAVVSYHMGVGNLQRVLDRFGAGVVPYVDVYFGSTPLDQPEAWRVLASLGDDSSTYLWRVRAAQAIMALSRSDPDGLQRLEELHLLDPGEVLVPPGAEADAPAGAGALQPATRAAMDWARRAVAAIAGGPSGLRVASTARNGHVAIVPREYRTPAHAEAFQFALDRLTALNAIAWVRDGDTIRVTGGEQALRLPPPPGA